MSIIESLHVKGFWRSQDLVEASVLDLVRQVGHVSREAEVLEPRASGEARDWSLSRHYGLRAFPWHTDGAISRHPPRYVALYARSVELGGATTDLLDVQARSSAQFFETVKSCVLRGCDSVGRPVIRRAYEVLEGSPCIRWDRRVFSVDAPRVRRAEDLLNRLQASHSVDWRDGMLIIFDNWRFLHRRSDVRPDEKRTLLRFYIH